MLTPIVVSPSFCYGLPICLSYIIFVFAHKCSYCILLGKNKSWIWFLIIFVGTQCRIFVSNIILELSMIDNLIDLNCLYNKISVNSYIVPFFYVIVWKFGLFASTAQRTTTRGIVLSSYPHRTSENLFMAKSNLWQGNIVYLSLWLICYITTLVSTKIFYNFCF